MKILTRKSLPLGGFAGLTEHRLVTDKRIFGARKSPETFNGIGNFVYLADAKFNPHGETHMHPHKEIDVITVMMDGRVSHEGSLEHGQNLFAGEVQVQRAGGEGFSHNEINPDNSKNRLLQLWVLPDELGQAAGYKHYVLKDKGVTRIYGGNKNQDATFNSHTNIDIVRLSSGERFNIEGESLVYLSRGKAELSDANSHFQSEEGDLIVSVDTEILAQNNVEVVVVTNT